MTRNFDIFSLATSQIRTDPESRFVFKSNINTVLKKISVTLTVRPWILERAGLESSGQRLIYLIDKSKRIAFFFAKFFSSDFWNFQFVELFHGFFWDFMVFIGFFGIWRLLGFLGFKKKKLQRVLLKVTQVTTEHKQCCLPVLYTEHCSVYRVFWKWFCNG